MPDALELRGDPPAVCTLCLHEGGRVIWSDESWRVVAVDDDDFPAFYRVISREHVAELSQLDAGRRARCLDLVCAIEAVLLDRLRPTKINLAALGNMVPHLHWHVIARFEWDSHFPEPIWGMRQRVVTPPARDRLSTHTAQLDDLLHSALDNVPGR
jgi:diadenosine tetraphosphate (Ap4A) HIT family hydrolase